MSINLGMLNGVSGDFVPALLQKRQWALHPFVTFTNKFTKGAIRLPGIVPS